MKGDKDGRPILRAVNDELDEQTLRADRQRYFTLYADLEEAGSKEWLVEGWFGAGEASAIYGAPGAAKSAVAEDLGLRIAARWEWHGKPVRGGAVVYIALERARLVKRRAIAFKKKHGLPDLPFAIVDGVHDFRDPKTIDFIADVCRRVAEITGEEVVLVIIDTLSRALAGGDENSPKDMGSIVTATAKLQEKTKAHIQWLHHMPHDGDRMRGHGALLGAMDTTVHVTKSGGGRVATVIKANDSEEGVSVTFDLESVTISDDGTKAPIVVPVEATARRSAAEPRLTETQRAFFRLLHDAGPEGFTTDDWNAKARAEGVVGNRRSTLVNLRGALKDKGLIREYSGRWHVNHN